MLEHRSSELSTLAEEGDASDNFKLSNFKLHCVMFVVVKELKHLADRFYCLVRHGQHLLLMLNGVRKPFLVSLPFCKILIMMSNLICCIGFRKKIAVKVNTERIEAVETSSRLSR